MVRCNNGTDGLDGKTIIRVNLQHCRLTDRKNQRINSHDLNDKKALPAKGQFEGLKSTTRRSKQRDPLEFGRRGKSRPLIHEAWRHFWPVTNDSRDKNP
jgi:hypothetical protein